MIHRYDIFEYEMLALKNWFKSLTPPGVPQNPLTHRDMLVKMYIASPLYDTVEFNQEPQPSKRQKIMYLNSLGLKSRDIQKYTQSSPNTIQKVLKEDKTFVRPDNPDFDKLIEAWQRIRKLIPDEIFIKYL